jgi:hypothetical protein
MTSAFDPLPSDLAAAHAMILAERAARVEAEAVAACAQAVNVSTGALIAHLKLEIEKLRRALYGSHSERKARLLEQMELQLEDLEAAATEDELAAEKAAARTQTVQSFQRKRPSRKPFPDHLPHERIVIAAPESCPCCGSTKLSKLGEDITETLEVIPRQWKVIQRVEQCRRKSAAWHRLRPKVVVIRRLRSRRTASRCHVQHHRHGQNERRRSASAAGRRPRPHR